MLTSSLHLKQPLKFWQSLTEAEVWINTLSQMSLSLFTLLILRDFWLNFSVMFISSSVCFLSAAFWGDIALDEDDLRTFRRRTVGTNRTDAGRINLPTWGQQVQTWRSEPIVSCVSLCSSWRQTEPPSPEEGGHLQTRAGVAWRHHPIRHQREFQWWVVIGNMIPCGASVSYTEGVTHTDPFQAAREPFSVRRCVTGRDTPAWRLRRGRLRRAT